MSREQVRKVTSIGGQALIEGIMMRGPKNTSIAVRSKDGTISSEDLKTTYLKDKFSIFRFPILRGIAGFVDSIVVGQRALKISAEKSGSLEDEKEKEHESVFSKFIREKLGDNILNVLLGFSMIIGVFLSIFLFMFLPTFIFNNTIGTIEGINGINILRSISEGIIKIIIFLAYIILCSQIDDIKRVFKYHGAEHKTIFCYESGEELTVENVKKHSRFHPRCGTSFLILMLLIGIVIGFFIQVDNAFFRTIIRLLCVPLLVGIGYELIKVCSKYDNKFTRIISAPGMWMQRITTKEPDDDMIEVAIKAIKEVIPENGEDILR